MSAQIFSKVGFWPKKVGKNLDEKLKKLLWPKKLGFCPVFFQKWAALEPSIHAGLRVFCPLAHFFFLICKK